MIKKVKLLDKKRFEKIIEVEEIIPVINYLTMCPPCEIKFELFGEENNMVIYKEIENRKISPKKMAEKIKKTLNEKANR